MVLKLYLSAKPMKTAMGLPDHIPPQDPSHAVA
jgi:hypothetical protein